MAAAALAGVEGRVIPVGLSMGGMVALEIWRQVPGRVAALALFDTDAGADTPQRRAKRDAQVLRAQHGEFRGVLEKELALGYFSAAQTPHLPLHDVVVSRALDQGVGAFAAQATALATRCDSWPLLERIAAPALVACGSEDRICLPRWHERMASLLPRATLRSIPRAGHLSSLEQPKAVSRVLRAWIDDIGPS